MIDSSVLGASRLENIGRPGVGLDYMNVFRKGCEAIGIESNIRADID